MRPTAWTMCGILAVAAPGAQAQEWNTPAAMELAVRAVNLRAERDLGFQDFTANARGFVVFLAQIGVGFEAPPRLVKADQLALEVYWKWPGASKQRVVGRRDRVEMPTAIAYHRDHLGIVPDNFRDRIRIGECDEVCDVPHPLSASGVVLYDFAIADSLTLRFAQSERVVRAYELRIRPKDLEAGRVVGSVVVDGVTGQIIQVRWTFTRAAYRDATLEDITVFLDNALWEGRVWLPRYQEIEVRRRTSWLDLPARGIIRTTLEVDDYTFDSGLADSLFRGAAIVHAPADVRVAHAWSGTLEESLRRHSEVGPGLGMDEVRRQVEEVVSRRMLSGLGRARPGARSISEIIRFNRVEGVAIGFGGVARPFGAELSGAAGYGFGDSRLTGRLGITAAIPAGRLNLDMSRTVRDISDEPVISTVVNSILAQEFGEDFGDYYLSSRVAASLTIPVRRVQIRVGTGIERVAPTAVNVAPASGTFRPNPDLGSGTFWTTTAGAGTERWRISQETGYRIAAAGEYGTGGAVDWLRFVGGAVARWTAGGTGFQAEVRGVWGSRGMPPHRVFVMGGRGTLPGERFRAYGGRSGAVVGVEWRVGIPFPEARIGTLVSTGDRAVAAPFFRAGVAGGGYADGPWTAESGVRPVGGVALELLHGIFRFEVGRSLRGSSGSVSIDIGRDFWGIL